MLTNTPPIEQIISNFLKSPNESTAKFLHDAMEEATYLVPAMEQDNLPAVLEGDAWNEVSLRTVPFKSDKGNILPVYTSQAEYQKDGKPAESMLCLSMDGLLNLMLNRKDIGFVLLNPAGSSISFERTQLLASFRMAIKETGQIQFEPGTVLTFAPVMHRFSKSEINRLRKAAGSYSEISRVWLAQKKADEQDPDDAWVLVIESDSFREDYFTVLFNAFGHLNKRGRLLVFNSNEEAAADIVASFVPFYRR